MPDPSSVVVDNLPATDTAGYAGLEDEVDFHIWRPVKGIALATLIGASTELAVGNGDMTWLRPHADQTPQLPATPTPHDNARRSS